MAVSKRAVFGCALVALAIFAGVVVLSFIGAKSTPSKNACVNNLRQLDRAKEAWRLENHKTSNDYPRWEDLVPYLREKPVCPEGGTYVLGRVADPPTCSLGGTHTLPR